MYFRVLLDVDGGLKAAPWPYLQEVGPYGIGFERRKHTWTEKANILFIDNPVGTGFSYVEEGTNLSK